MSKIKLYQDVESMIKIMPRIETLYYFVYELVQCFHADQNTLNSVKTGILDNQILNKIYLEYLNNSGEKVAGVTISIDWEKHKMLAKTNNGKEIPIDMSKSIVDNIVGWRKYVVAHIDTVMNQYGVITVKSGFSYRNTITSNEDTYQKAHKIMNQVQSTTSTPTAINRTLQNELDTVLINALSSDKIEGDVIKRTLDTGTLEEIEVELYYKKKK